MAWTVEGGEPGTARDDVEGVIRALQALPPQQPLTLMLDYDGSLVPIAPVPPLAQPDGALLTLLRALCNASGLEVHIVSGRDRRELDAWLGGLEAHLHAEHGLWTRLRGRTWERLPTGPLDWRPGVRALMDRLAAEIPGAFVEEKSASLAWHYRAAEPERGAAGAARLAALMRSLLTDVSAEVLHGHKVIEVRPCGVHKGRIVEHVPGLAGRAILAVGDDVTDEDLFAALPADAVLVKVGAGDSRARLRLPGPDEVRAVLVEILKHRVIRA